MITIVLENPTDFNYFNNTPISDWTDDLQWFIDILYDYQNYTVYINLLPDGNGNWFGWGQNPFKYVETYQTFALAFKEQLPNIQMVWTVGAYDGYPEYGRAVKDLPPSLNDTNIQPYLDSNYNGYVDAKDDPFNPYYPGGKGDALVDWIGYNFEFAGVNNVTGTSNENIIPRSGAFYDGFNRFYQLACKKRKKPVMITSTSSYYSQTQAKGGTDSNLAIKTEWINQVYSKNMTQTFPFVKAILWYEQLDTDGDIAYQISGDPAIVSAYQKVLSDNYWTKAQTFSLTDLIKRYAEYDQAGYQSVSAARSLISSSSLVMTLAVVVSSIFFSIIM